MSIFSLDTLFPLGQVVITPAALDIMNISGVSPVQLVARHVHGDWGNLCDEDREQNELSLREGYRLLSSYSVSYGEKQVKECTVWVITEADRSVTTVLLPQDY